MNKQLERPTKNSTLAAMDALGGDERHLHRMETVVHAEHKAVELLYYNERPLENGYGALFEGPDALAETIQRLPGRHYKGKSPESLKMFVRQSLPLEGKAQRPVSEKLAKSIHVAMKSRVGSAEYLKLRTELDEAIGRDREGRKLHRKAKAVPKSVDLWSRFTAGEMVRVYSNSIMQLMDSGAVTQFVRRNIVRPQSQQLPKVRFIFPTATECTDFWGILDNMFLIQAREFYSISSHISMAGVRNWLSELERDQRLGMFYNPAVDEVRTPYLVSDAINKDIRVFLLDAHQDHQQPNPEELAALTMSEMQYAEALSVQANN